MANGQPCKLATAAAQNAAANLPVGFDPTILITIFSALFPVLQKLMAGCLPTPTPAAADYRTFVAQRYRRGHYGPVILRHARREAAEQAAAAGKPVNDADAETMAVSLLDQVRTGSDPDITEAMQTAGV